MVKTFTTNTFANVYRDDYDEDKSFQRILFNNKKALQARELTQLQTIIQEGVNRFGKNIFKEGAAVSAGGVAINNRYRFIKLDTSTNALPANSSSLVGKSFVGQTSGVTIKILEVVLASSPDPDTLYVQYTNTLSGTSSTETINISPSEELVENNGSTRLIVQTTNTAINPAYGFGTKFSSGNQDFFTQGFFVHAPQQEIILSKYTNDISKVVGFKVEQDIVTVDDDVTLYDNQGSVPNQTAPGADRFRIKLVLTTQDLITSGQTFVYVANVVNSKIAERVTGLDQYNLINDLMAVRTNDESGDYTVTPFFIRFEDSA